MQDLIKRNEADKIDPVPGEIVYVISIKERGEVLAVVASPTRLLYQVGFDDVRKSYLYCNRSEIIRVPQ